MQMAAVMALRFSAKAPKGASTSVATPVRVMSLGDGHVVARRADGRHAGQVLRGHGDNEQRQRQADQGAKVNSGAVNTGRAHSKTSTPALNWPLGQHKRHRHGQRERHRVTRQEAAAQQVGQQHGSTSGSAVCAAAKACNPKRASTPASSADAMAMGMRFMTRSNQPVAPARTMSTAHTMKAPTACAMENPPASPAVASTAAPGVLQATMTGCFRISEGMAEHNPMPRPSAHIQEVMSSGVAPKASAAWKTMATELVKPTSTATKPAVAADRLRSRKKDIRHRSACHHGGHS
jgi:hypothetical protein